MDITVEKQENCAARLRAVVPAETVEQERKSIAAAYTGQAKIPGFRPGKAPLSVVLKRFAKEINDELASRMFSRATDEAVASEPSLKILDFGNPEVCETQDDGTFVIETAMTFIPAFEIPEYMGLKITATSTEVTEDDITKGMEDLLQRYSDYEPVDRPVATGDIAVIDFSATCEGKPVAEVIGKPAGFLDGREGQWIRIEEDSFLPGFAMELVGAKVEDKKIITITIPESFPLSEIRGKDVALDVFVKEVRELHVPELNDEFAAKILPEGGLAELKERMKEILQNTKKEEAENEKVDQVANILADAVDFALPEMLVQRATDDLFRNRLQTAFQSLQGCDDIEKEIEKMKEESKEQASKNLKVHFILQDIARKEGIKVTDQELGMEIYRIAESQKKQPKAVLKELRKNGQMQGIAQGILSNKTVSYILEKAEVTESAAPVAEEAPQTEAAEGESTEGEAKPAKKVAAKKPAAKKAPAKKKTEE